MKREHNNNLVIGNNSSDIGVKRKVKKPTRTNKVTPYSPQEIRRKIFQNYILLGTTFVSFKSNKHSNIIKKESIKRSMEIIHRLKENAREQHELKLNYPLSDSKLNHNQNSPDNNSNTSSSNFDSQLSNSCTSPILNRQLDFLNNEDDIHEEPHLQIHDILNKQWPQSQKLQPIQQIQSFNQSQAEVNHQSFRDSFLNALNQLTQNPTTSNETTYISNVGNVNSETQNTSGVVEDNNNNLKGETVTANTNNDNVFLEDEIDSFEIIGINLSDN